MNSNSFQEKRDSKRKKAATWEYASLRKATGREEEQLTPRLAATSGKKCCDSILRPDASILLIAGAVYVFLAAEYTQQKKTGEM